MKLLRKVSALKVKRAFVASDYVAHQGVRHYLPHISRKIFLARLTRAKKYVHKLSEARLDKIIGLKYPKRIAAYNSLTWYVGEASLRELGVWRNAGNLPSAWMRGSLAGTAKKVSAAIRKHSKSVKGRAAHSISGISEISLVDVQKNLYLLPIILPAGTIKSCRRGIKKFQGDIDDGCMRSIALAISGKKKIIAYIGKSMR